MKLDPSFLASLEKIIRILRNHLLLVLGVSLVLVSALGRIPLGTQPLPVIGEIWRYILLGVGVFLILAGCWATMVACVSRLRNPPGGSLELMS
jgi:hypothetical protein